MTWNDFLEDILFYAFPMSNFNNLEFPKDFRYQIREISREECYDCEYNGKVHQYEEELINKYKEIENHFQIVF
jgi:hypothetical protein